MTVAAGEVTNFQKAFIFPFIKIANKKAGCCTAGFFVLSGAGRLPLTCSQKPACHKPPLSRRGQRR
jgi:hypothetical protein